VEVVRLDKKLGIRASDTASITLTDCRIPKDNLLGTSDIDTKVGFGGVMQTFDNTRPVVAGMAVGVARAALEHTRTLLEEEGIKVRYRGSLFAKSAAEAELIRMEADWEAGRLLMLKAAWMADNGIPNSTEASMSKAKAARVGNQITLRCVELCGSLGYCEAELLEKWARDSKILDIFEGTQQIQLLIVARSLLGKRSSELR
jgi:acyl-CoA dehydrogenase